MPAFCIHISAINQNPPEEPSRPDLAASYHPSDLLVALAHATRGLPDRHHLRLDKHDSLSSIEAIPPSVFAKLFVSRFLLEWLAALLAESGFPFSPFSLHKSVLSCPKLTVDVSGW